MKKSAILIVCCLMAAFASAQTNTNIFTSHLVTFNEMSNYVGSNSGGGNAKINSLNGNATNLNLVGNTTGNGGGVDVTLFLAAGITNVLGTFTPTGDFIHTFEIGPPAREMSVYWAQQQAFGYIFQTNEAWFLSVASNWTTNSLGAGLATNGKGAMFRFDGNIYTNFNSFGVYQPNAYFTNTIATLNSNIHALGMRSVMYFNIGGFTNIDTGAVGLPTFNGTYSQVYSNVLQCSKDGFDGINIDGFKDFHGVGGVPILGSGERLYNQWFNEAIMKSGSRMILITTDNEFTDNVAQDQAVISSANYFVSGSGGIADPSTFNGIFLNTSNGFVTAKQINRKGASVEAYVVIPWSVTTNVLKVTMTGIATLGSTFYVGATNTTAAAKLYITNFEILNAQADPAWAVAQGNMVITNGNFLWINVPLGNAGMSNKMGIINNDVSPHTYTYSATNFGFPSTCYFYVRDVWNATNFPLQTNTFSYTVNATDSAFLIGVLVNTNGMGDIQMTLAPDKTTWKTAKNGILLTQSGDVDGSSSIGLGAHFGADGLYIIGPSSFGHTDLNFWDGTAGGKSTLLYEFRSSQAFSPANATYGEFQFWGRGDSPNFPGLFEGQFDAGLVQQNWRLFGAAAFMSANGANFTNATNVNLILVNQLAATNIAFTLTQTNFILNQVYTNTNTAPIQVSAMATIVTTGVSGNAGIALRVVNVQTNTVGLNTLVTSIAMNYTNMLSGFVPSLGVYTFTNISSGAGDSASVSGGQYIIY